MLEGLANSLQRALAKLKAKGKLTEEDVQEAMREVRLALLAADVNVKVVKDFVERVRARAIGQEVQQSLTPGQQVVKIVYEELTELMGGSQTRLRMAPHPPTVVMMVGLQGSGKTTTTAKLALSFRRHQHRPLMVAADVYRPAAIRQLEVLGRQIDVPVFSLGEGEDPVRIAEAGVAEARRMGADVVLIDTAGRTHVDEALMQELERMQAQVHPDEVLLVVDAMMGQDAVHVAEAFHTRLGVTGVVLTKLDSDTRGGAALTIRAVTGCPIKFVGMGEKIEPLEAFHPDRLASRILGMGDVLSLIERAQQAVDEQTAKEMEQKLRQARFTLDDFRQWLQQAQKLGPLDQLLSMIPGVNKLKGIENLSWDDKRFKRMEAIILSMTPEERANPDVMNASRRRRVANGSGVTVREVNQLLNQFEQMQQMMKRFSGLGRRFGRRGAALQALKGLDLPDLGMSEPLSPSRHPGEGRRRSRKSKRR
ncbi:signal recognition particle protein [Alicyclobacillus cellulosilyticus]|uniref:Signal recognition particle protein n=1 Tax=Alicyclobacillus cellulosilyticus TaxID=1003997 RepID=A0A917KEV4_9BACL|nr:signal recognition particle protein [Alicyclobacillus cellulosilyticus]GGJ07949.1 signal recognition particle protein [Alicyclobacillus cellulosilyticus]